MKALGGPVEAVPTGASNPASPARTTTYFTASAS